MSKPLKKKNKIKEKYYVNNPKKMIPFYKQAYFHIHDKFFEITCKWLTHNKDGKWRKDFWNYLQNKLKELEEETRKQYRKKLEELEKSKKLNKHEER